MGGAFRIRDRLSNLPHAMGELWLRSIENVRGMLSHRSDYDYRDKFSRKERRGTRNQKNKRRHRRYRQQRRPRRGYGAERNSRGISPGLSNPGLLNPGRWMKDRRMNESNCRRSVPGEWIRENERFIRRPQPEYEDFLGAGGVQYHGDFAYDGFPPPGLPQYMEPNSISYITRESGMY